MWTLHLLREKTAEEAAARVPAAKQAPVAAVPPQNTLPFTDDDISRFPALRSRNYWCIQRHQATRHHYDLRLHVGEGLYSWAIPRGLLGMSSSGENARLAVETPIHPLSHAVWEGPDSSRNGRGTRMRSRITSSLTQVLWDIGRYEIREVNRSNSDSPREDEAEDGAFDEEKLRLKLSQISAATRDSFHIILHSGSKMTHHEYVMVCPRDRKPMYGQDGKEKREWIIRLPKGADEYSWGPGGEDGPHSGPSAKSGLYLHQVVCQDVGSSSSKSK